MVSGPPTCDTHLLNTVPGTLIIFKILYHRLVCLLPLCANYLKKPLRLVLPTAGVRETHLHVFCVESRKWGA